MFYKRNLSPVNFSECAGPVHPSNCLFLSLAIHFENKHRKLTLEMDRCVVADTKKDKSAARERIRASGPQLTAGKRMKKVTITNVKTFLSPIL